MKRVLVFIALLLYFSAWEVGGQWFGAPLFVGASLGFLAVLVLGALVWFAWFVWIAAGVITGAITE